jgi:hypothetical protein
MAIQKDKTPGRILLAISPSKLIFLLALLKFLLPFLIQSSAYEPHRDEFLYMEEARHLDWGYLEVPPLMSVFSYLSNWMGGSLFWIRIWPSLFGSLTFLVVARWIVLLGGGKFGILLGFLPFVFGYFVHVYFIFQPNFLEGFFWTCMAYGLVLHIHSARPLGLYLAAVALGLGMLSKYSVFFFAVSLFLGLLVTKERKILLNRHFYYALLIAFGIFLPNIIWQFHHGFPEIYHLKELQKQQLQNVGRVDFLADQLLLNLPCIYIWISGLFWVSFVPEAKSYRFIGWAALVVVAIFVAGHGKSYYGMALYPTLFAFGAVYVERLIRDQKKSLPYILVAYTILTGLFIDSVSLPFLAPKELANYYAHSGWPKKLRFLRWEDQKDHPLPQDFADMLAWKDLTEKMAKVYDSLDSNEKKQTILDCDNYGEAAGVDYYGRSYHLPEVICHQANYLFWVPPDFYKSSIVILATDYPQAMREDFVREFRFSKVMDSISNPLAREFGSRIILLKGPSQKSQKMWKDYYESLAKDTRAF